MNDWKIILPNPHKAGTSTIKMWYNQEDWIVGISVMYTNHRPSLAPRLTPRLSILSACQWSFSGILLWCLWRACYTERTLWRSSRSFGYSRQPLILTDQPGVLSVWVGWVMKRIICTQWPTRGNYLYSVTQKECSQFGMIWMMKRMICTQWFIMCVGSTCRILRGLASYIHTEYRFGFICTYTIL